MRAFRFVLLLAASAAIAFALYSANQSGVSVTSADFLKIQGIAFAGGFLAATVIFMKNKEEKK